jgi:hypothetical protein
MSEEIRRLLCATIGRTAIIEGRHVRVVEVLTEGPALVLEERDGQAVVQADLHGNPQRRVPHTATIPVSSNVREGLHPVVEALLTRAERERLLALLTPEPSPPPD